MENENTYRHAIKLWGVTNQMDMATEECAELIQAINKVKRTFSRAELVAMMMQNQFTNRDNAMPKFRTESEALIYQQMCSEIVDVKIMMEQLSLIFNRETLELIYERKITRLKGRLKKDDQEWKG